MGLGIASSCGRVGGMIIPFIAQVRVNVHLAPNPPTHGRASQLSCPSGLCGCAVLLSLILQSLIQVNDVVTIVVFVAMAAINLVLVALLPIETKGRSLRVRSVL